jgi:hypothetical protein
LAELGTARERLAELLHVRSQDVNTFRALDKLADLGRRLIAVPPMDRTALTNNVWEVQRERIVELVRRGNDTALARAELDNVVSDAAWETDWLTLRQGLKRGWWVFRWLNRDFRNATTSLRALLKVPLPKSDAERLKTVDSILTYRSSMKCLEAEGRQLGSDAFGSFWQGHASDWPALDRIVQWEQTCRDAHLPKSFREIAAKVRNPDALTKPATLLSQLLPDFLSQVAVVFQELSFNLAAAFGVNELQLIAPDELRTRLQAWQTAPEALARWINHRLRKIQVEGGSMTMPAGAPSSLPNSVMWPLLPTCMAKGR